MKTPQKTPYRVTMRDGTTRTVCCGPAILKLGVNVRGYEPAGPPQAGLCCHDAPHWDRLRQRWADEWAAVRAWLSKRA